MQSPHADSIARAQPPAARDLNVARKLKTPAWALVVLQAGGHAIPTGCVQNVFVLCRCRGIHFPLFCHSTTGICTVLWHLESDRARLLHVV